MQYRSFLAWPNNLGSTTCPSTRLGPSQGTILDRLHTLGDHRISIRSQSYHLPRAFLRILCRVDRGGCALRRLTERQEVTNHPVMLGMALVWMVMGWVLPVRTTLCLAGGAEGGALLACRMTNGQDSGKIIM